MKIKGIVGVLAATVVMSLMCVSAQAAVYSAGAATSKPGESVTIPVSVAPTTEGVAEAVNGYIVKLTYDGDVLNPVNKGTEADPAYAVNDLNKGIMVSGIVEDTATQGSDLVIGWANAEAEAISAETVLANVEFAINPNTAVKSTDVQVTVMQAAKSATAMDSGYTTASGVITLGEDFLLGDINNDGTVDAIDSGKLFQYVSGTVTLEQFKAENPGVEQRADVYPDGNIDAIDSGKLFQLVSGTISSLAD